MTAALDLFIEQGFAATRMEDVAERAGVAKGTLYLYFSSKDELFKTVVRKSTLPIFGNIGTVIDNFNGDSVSLFRNIVLEWWEQIGNFRPSSVNRLVLTEASRFPELAKAYLEDVFFSCNEIVGRLLSRGVERGEFRKADMPYLTEVIVGPMIVIVMLEHSFGVDQIEHVSPTTYLNNFIDLCLYGLLSPQDDYTANL